MSMSSKQSDAGNRKSLWIGSVASVVIVASVALVCWWLFGDRLGSRQAKAWYYDLNTGQLFVADTTTNVPIAAPAGPTADGKPAGVRAFVFSHGDCANASERFIGWLETTSSTQPAVSAPREGGGRLIRREKDTDWTPADSSRGIQIINEALQGQSDGRPVVPCEPE